MSRRVVAVFLLAVPACAPGQKTAAPLAAAAPPAASPTGVSNEPPVAVASVAAPPSSAAAPGTTTANGRERTFTSEFQGYVGDHPIRATVSYVMDPDAPEPTPYDFYGELRFLGTT